MKKYYIFTMLVFLVSFIATVFTYDVYVFASYILVFGISPILIGQAFRNQEKKLIYIGATLGIFLGLYVAMTFGISLTV